MAHRLLRDIEADAREPSDFPIVCQSCLGDNPYLRMTKADYGKECKICTRPFNVFRWRPGRDARYKKTEICQTCTKLKNVCQVCLLDLEYDLPVQVRDTVLHTDSDDAIPRSDVNREYFTEKHDHRARAGIDFESSFEKVRANDTILKLQRTMPYYKRNRAHVCSFYVRGKCTRGLECAYRHELPETGELSQQNIKDRYYGVNDPVALKLLGKPQVSKPESDISNEARQQVTMAHTGLMPRDVISQLQNPPRQPPTQQERTVYPSMDAQRMGALIPSQGGSSGPSGENKSGPEQKHPGQRFAYAGMTPSQGQFFHPYYPSYGYMPPPPAAGPNAYQQHPPFQPPVTMPSSCTKQVSCISI